MIDLIILGILLLSLVAMGVTIVRKFPLLASIETKAGASLLHQRKTDLLEQRLTRKMRQGWTVLSQRAKPVSAVTRQWWGTVHKKLVDLEHEYKVRSLPVLLNRVQRRKVDSEISGLIDQARALLHDGEMAASEAKALQAIRLEPRSVPAFEFLAELYMQTKEYGQAKEVYRYLLKLTGESDAIYEHLGEADAAEGHLTEAVDEFKHAIDLNRTVTAYHLDLAHAERQLGNWTEALAAIEEATRLEPNSPKVLDEYIEVAMGAGKRQFAQAALEKIRDVNPENSKIADWEQKIHALPARLFRPVAEPDQTIAEETISPVDQKDSTPL